MRTYNELPEHIRFLGRALVYAVKNIDHKKPATRKRVCEAFFHFERNYRSEYKRMAGKEGKGAFGDFKFAAITLTVEDKANFEAWATKAAPTMLDQLAELVMEGWKTSVTWDSENDCFIASATCRTEKHKNENIVVTSRSDVFLEAFALTFWKISVLFKGKALPTEKVKQNWG